MSEQGCKEIGQDGNLKTFQILKSNKTFGKFIAWTSWVTLSQKSF